MFKCYNFCYVLCGIICTTDTKTLKGDGVPNKTAALQTSMKSAEWFIFQFDILAAAFRFHLEGATYFLSQLNITILGNRIEIDLNLLSK